VELGNSTPSVIKSEKLEEKVISTSLLIPLKQRRLRQMWNILSVWCGTAFDNSMAHEYGFSSQISPYTPTVPLNYSKETRLWQ
jgi:hypothetical protein